MFRMNHEESDRSAWGPLLVVLGPQFSNKLNFLKGLEERITTTCIDACPDLHYAVPLTEAIAIWQRDATAEQAQRLSKTMVHQVSILDRLKSPKCQEQMLLTLFFLKKISFEELKNRLAVVIQDTQCYDTLVSALRVVLATKHNHQKKQRGLITTQIQLNINEAIPDATEAALKNVKRAIKMVKHLVAWDDGNVHPVYFYKQVLQLAAKYGRVVRFVRWGQELKYITRHELFVKNIKHFLQTGRYVDVKRIDAYYKGSELMANKIHGRMLSHYDLANHSGFHMDEIGRVCSGPMKPYNFEPIDYFDRTTWHSDWALWTNHNRVASIDSMINELKIMVNPKSTRSNEDLDDENAYVLSNSDDVDEFLDNMSGGKTSRSKSRRDEELSPLTKSTPGTVSSNQSNGGFFRTISFRSDGGTPDDANNSKRNLSSSDKKKSGRSTRIDGHSSSGRKGTSSKRSMIHQSLNAYNRRNDADNSSLGSSSLGDSFIQSEGFVRKANVYQNLLHTSGYRLASQPRDDGSLGSRSPSKSKMQESASWKLPSKPAKEDRGLSDKRSKERKHRSMARLASPGSPAGSHSHIIASSPGKSARKKGNSFLRDPENGSNAGSFCSASSGGSSKRVRKNLPVSAVLANSRSQRVNFHGPVRTKSYRISLHPDAATHGISENDASSPKSNGFLSAIAKKMGFSAKQKAEEEYKPPPPKVLRVKRQSDDSMTEENTREEFKEDYESPTHRHHQTHREHNRNRDSRASQSTDRFSFYFDEIYGPTGDESDSDYDPESAAKLAGWDITNIDEGQDEDEDEGFDSPVLNSADRSNSRISLPPEATTSAKHAAKLFNPSFEKSPLAVRRKSQSGKLDVQTLPKSVAITSPASNTTADTSAASPGAQSTFSMESPSKDAIKSTQEPLVSTSAPKEDLFDHMGGGISSASMRGTNPLRAASLSASPSPSKSSKEKHVTIGITPESKPRSKVDLIPAPRKSISSRIGAQPSPTPESVEKDSNSSPVPSEPQDENEVPSVITTTEAIAAVSDSVNKASSQQTHVDPAVVEDNVPVAIKSVEQKKETPAPVSVTSASTSSNPVNKVADNDKPKPLARKMSSGDDLWKRMQAKAKAEDEGRPVAVSPSTIKPSTIASSPSPVKPTSAPAPNMKHASSGESQSHKSDVSVMSETSSKKAAEDVSKIIAVRRKSSENLNALTSAVSNYPPPAISPQKEARPTLAKAFPSVQDSYDTSDSEEEEDDDDDSEEESEEEEDSDSEDEEQTSSPQEVSKQNKLSSLQTLGSKSMSSTSSHNLQAVSKPSQPVQVKPSDAVAALGAAFGTNPLAAGAATPAAQSGRSFMDMGGDESSEDDSSSEEDDSEDEEEDDDEEEEDEDEYSSDEDDEQGVQEQKSMHPGKGIVPASKTKNIGKNSAHNPHNLYAMLR